MRAGALEICLEPDQVLFEGIYPSFLAVSPHPLAAFPNDIAAAPVEAARGQVVFRGMEADPAFPFERMVSSANVTAYLPTPCRRYPSSTTSMLIQDRVGSNSPFTRSQAAGIPPTERM